MGTRLLLLPRIALLLSIGQRQLVDAEALNASFGYQENALGETFQCPQLENISETLKCHGDLRVKVLTYNLFWWNLFTLRAGKGRSSGRLIAATGWPEAYDLMGFQECDDVRRVIRDSGLQHQYETIQGPHALGVAFRKAAWELLSQGVETVAEDSPEQWFGRRSGLWVRFRHRSTGKTLFFVNHHGPLPQSSGGKCGGEATAQKLLSLISNHSKPDQDNVMLIGDFNAVKESPTIQILSKSLHRIFSGHSHGGIDHIFSSCPDSVGTWNLGPGGSDHDALSTIISA